MKNFFRQIKKKLTGRFTDKGMTSNILQKIAPDSSPEKLAEGISQHFQHKEDRKARLLKTVQGNILKKNEKKLSQRPEEPASIPRLSIIVLTNSAGVLKIGPTDEPTEKPLDETEPSALTQLSSDMAEKSEEKDKG